MKTGFALLTAVVMMATNLFSQEIRYQFADIPWGSTLPAVRDQLTSHGYTVDPTDKDGDVPFSGSILNRSVTGYAMMSPTAGLVKIAIFFDTDVFGPEYKDIYRQVVNTMTQRYGAGQDFRWFESPYEDGDGYEDTALRVGKGHISTSWDGPSKESGLVVRVMKTLGILVSYETTMWSAELDRRQASAF